MGVVCSNDYPSVSKTESVEELFGDHSLLEMITNTPSAKTAATPSFCFIFICSLMTIVIGSEMMMASDMMLTTEGSVNGICRSMDPSLHRMVIQ